MSGAPTGALSPASGPSFSFGFNLAKIDDHGEDSDPILRDGPDLGLVGVFDGMGGAGGTVYETPDGARSGAYISSRIARDVVEERMLDLLEPNWNLQGAAAAEDLRESVQTALQEKLADLKAPVSRLRSKLLRALPTTMAIIALQRTHSGAARWTCHVFWAGDSRAYVLQADGLRQLSTDDLREPGDAMSNLHQDSVVSNAMSADTDFHVNYRRVELDAPFVLLCATDGCFGYLPSPMHFERLLLRNLVGARSAADWSARIQTDISAVTGDDAAMSVMGVGVEFAQAQSLFTNRLAELERGVIAPLDQAASAVLQAEADLARLRHKQVEVAASLWSAYQPGYELFLNERFAEPEEAGAVEGSESTTDVAESTGDTESSTSPGSSNSAESSDSADSSTAPDSSTSADLPASAPAAANAEASTADDTSETDSTKEGVWR